MPNILSIETATSSSSLALLSFSEKDEQPKLIFSQSVAGERRASQLATLLPEIDLVDGVALTIGPGSFTGIRAGLALAKGLVMPGNLPLYPVSSLKARAYIVKDYLVEIQLKDIRGVVLLDAGRGRYYVLFFEADAAANRGRDNINLNFKFNSQEELLSGEELLAVIQSKDINLVISEELKSEQLNQLAGVIKHHILINEETLSISNLKLMEELQLVKKPLAYWVALSAMSEGKRLVGEEISNLYPNYIQNMLAKTIKERAVSNSLL
jgi:tRNA threonylcarbamoyl adenosine modification protein YeaZ